MGRRGDHSYQQLSDMIIKAAYQQVERDGYAKVSTRKIASEIGYTVGTLYNIFKNLDDIFIHVNALTLDQLYDEFTKALKADTGNSKMNPIKALTDVYVKFSQENFHLWNTLFEYKFSSDQVMPKWYTEKINKIYPIVIDALSMSNPAIPQSSLQEVVIVIWSAIHGICSLSIKGKLDRVGSQSAQVLIDNFLDNYLRGLTSK